MTAHAEQLACRALANQWGPNSERTCKVAGFFASFKDVARKTFASPVYGLLNGFVVQHWQLIVRDEETVDPLANLDQR
jgi:hypothetical protein